MAQLRDVVGDFWRAIDGQDWNLLYSTLAPDFERVGPSGEDEDVYRGRDEYHKYASTNIEKVGKYGHQVLNTFYSPDRRFAVSETLESIANDGQDLVQLKLLNLFALDEDGLLTSLSLYWKTPATIPESWRAVEGLRVAAGPAE
ncbi:hypothetical protein [Mycobacterium sp.]|uniref:hypothetical protein n=1 Tax=Mycobacterium sp. TaxID=1785 RepID=UPI003BB16248